MTIDGVWIADWIHWTSLQLLTTFHVSLSQWGQCPQSHCLVTASNGGRSSAFGLTSLQGGDHLTTMSYSDHWLQLLTPELEWVPTSNIQLQLSERTKWWLLNCCWSSPEQWFVFPSPARSMTIFYSLTALGAFRHTFPSLNHKWLLM
jgi:hypothetical protein